jgi:oligosaccharide repeat unit polymerase
MNVGGLLLLLYSFSSLMAVVIFNTDFLTYKDQKIAISSCIYYCGMLTLFIQPFLYQKQQSPVSILRVNTRTFMFVSYALIIVNLTGIILSSRSILYVLTHDPGSFKTRTLNLSSSANFGAIDIVGQYFLGHFSDFYIVILLLFFYSVCFKKNTAFFNTLLFLSSMTTILNGMYSGGRTQMIYWVLIISACYIYFNKHIPSIRKRYLNTAVIGFGIIFALYFISVSTFRFEDAYNIVNAKESVLYKIAEYCGMSFLQFNDFFVNFKDDNFTIARIFPISFDVFSNSKFDLIQYRESLSMDIGTFYTFLGDLFVDVGIWGTVAYLIGYRILFGLTQRPHPGNAKSFHQILIYFMLLQIPLNGLFFYSLWNKTATIAVTGTILLSILFKLSEKSASQRVKALNHGASVNRS